MKIDPVEKALKNKITKGDITDETNNERYATNLTAKEAEGLKGCRVCVWHWLENNTTADDVVIIDFGLDKAEKVKGLI